MENMPLSHFFNNTEQKDDSVMLMKPAAAHLVDLRLSLLGSCTVCIPRIICN